MNYALSKVASLLAGAISAAAIAAPSYADTASSRADTGQFVQDVGGDQRINYSGKLRMLSQRIPAAACNLHAGIAPTSSRTALNGAVEEFQGILEALEYGDDSRGIYGKEERFRTLRVIQEVHSIFDPMEAALHQSGDAALTQDATEFLADHNLALLDIAKLLVSELTGQYANPVALSQADAMTIDIAGRQRMLTQKMSKEVCLTLSGIQTEAATAGLTNSVNLFEASLTALENGMSEVGIIAPPTEGIVVGLAIVRADWTAVRPAIDAVAAGETLTDEQRALVFEGLNTTLKNMNTVVGYYAAASKTNL